MRRFVPCAASVIAEGRVSPEPLDRAGRVAEVTPSKPRNATTSPKLTVFGKRRWLSLWLSDRAKDHGLTLPRLFPTLGLVGNGGRGSIWLWRGRRVKPRQR